MILIRTRDNGLPVFTVGEWRYQGWAVCANISSYFWFPHTPLNPCTVCLVPKFEEIRLLFINRNPCLRLDARCWKHAVEISPSEKVLKTTSNNRRNRLQWHTSGYPINHLGSLSAQAFYPPPPPPPQKKQQGESVIFLWASRGLAYYPPTKLLIKKGDGQLTWVANYVEILEYGSMKIKLYTMWPY